MRPHQIVSSGERVLETIPVASGGVLDIDLDRGWVEVTSHDSDEVTIEANASGWASRMARFTLSSTPTGLQLEGDIDGWFHRFFGAGRVEVRARVPRRYSVEIRTRGGRVHATEIGGDFGAQTTGGRIEVCRIDGRALLRTSGGRILAEEINGDLRAHTTGGRIELAYVNGDVEARTSGGRIEAYGVRGEIDARTSGGAITATFVDDARGRVETSGGNIRVLFPAGLGVNLDARTSGGRVRVDHEITQGLHEQPRRVVAELNGGGPSLDLITSGGGIRVEAG